MSAGGPVLTEASGVNPGDALEATFNLSGLFNDCFVLIVAFGEINLGLGAPGCAVTLRENDSAGRILGEGMAGVVWSACNPVIFVFGKAVGKGYGYGLPFVGGLINAVDIDVERVRRIFVRVEGDSLGVAIPHIALLGVGKP